MYMDKRNFPLQRLKVLKRIRRSANIETWNEVAKSETLDCGVKQKIQMRKKELKDNIDEMRLPL